MTNQSKWLISAYAIFYAAAFWFRSTTNSRRTSNGNCSTHSGASVLITEYPIWRQLERGSGPLCSNKCHDHSGHRSAHRTPILPVLIAGKSFASSGEPAFVPRTRKDVACIVYSSGTGGRPKGCMMTHENYLEQCVALTSLYPFAPGIRYLSILPTNHAIDFMVGFFGPVHLRRNRRASAHAAPGICARSVFKIQNHLRQPRSARPEKSAERFAGALR